MVGKKVKSCPRGRDGKSNIYLGLTLIVLSDESGSGRVFALRNADDEAKGRYESSNFLGILLMRLCNYIRFSIINRGVRIKYFDFEIN